MSLTALLCFPTSPLIGCDPIRPLLFYSISVSLLDLLIDMDVHLQLCEYASPAECGGRSSDLGDYLVAFDQEQISPLSVYRSLLRDDLALHKAFNRSICPPTMIVEATHLKKSPSKCQASSIPIRLSTLWWQTPSSSQRTMFSSLCTHTGSCLPRVITSVVCYALTVSG